MRTHFVASGFSHKGAPFVTLVDYVEELVGIVQTSHVLRVTEYTTQIEQDNVVSTRQLDPITLSPLVDPEFQLAGYAINAMDADSFACKDCKLATDVVYELIYQPVCDLCESSEIHGECHVPQCQRCGEDLYQFV